MVRRTRSEAVCGEAMMPASARHETSAGNARFRRSPEPRPTTAFRLRSRRVSDTAAHPASE